jgi:HEAT repeat protein
VSEALHALATGDDKELKAIALQQLISSGAEQASELVVDSIKNGDQGSEYLITSAIMSGGRGSEEVIHEAAQSKSPATRAALANALSMRGGDQESIELLHTLSRDDDASVKHSAIYAMANVGSKESMDRLIEMASNGDKETRQVALSAVGNSGDARATPLIADALRSGDDDLARNAIYSAYNAGPEVDDALLSLAENGDTDMYLRQQAVEALVNRGADVNESTLEELKELTQANDPHGHHFGIHEF